ncbi:hypothetical protein AHiyo8_01060 [Arthrobacter sp. Hiyo8]|nr:hypothetical protein AHiyo8_01060 [Arthrobacter sp. Hiyo8]
MAETLNTQNPPTTASPRSTTPWSSVLAHSRTLRRIWPTKPGTSAVTSTTCEPIEPSSKLRLAPVRCAWHEAEKQSRHSRLWNIIDRVRGSKR